MATEHDPTAVPSESQPTPAPAPTPSTAIQTEAPAPASSTAIQTEAPAAKDGSVIPLPPTTPAPEAPPISPRQAALNATLDRVLGALVLVLSFLLASFAIQNSDFWRHLATGRLLAGGEYTFGEDPFSYATEGVYWANHSWLFDWILYTLYNLVGGAGLVVVKGLLVVALAVVLCSIRRRDQPLWVPLLFTALAVLAVSPRLLMQPICVSFLFLGLTLYLLNRYGTTGDWRLWLLPPLFALWINLDSWYVLGPLTVALFLLGELLQRLVGPKQADAPARLRPLALVLLAGLAACLLNPHHYHALTLPPELAYLTVNATDWISHLFGIQLSLPEEMVASGRTMQALYQYDPRLTLFLSPLTRLYWSSPVLGFNAAGMTFYLLFLMGLASFALSPWNLRWSRLLVWLPLGLLAAWKVQMIPFFAVVAGPIAALNFQDSVAHLATLPGAGARPRTDLSLLGRLAAILGCLVLLVFAWPGLLHGEAADEPRTTRRVAWHVEIDPSLKEAAEFLHEVRQNPNYQLGNGFNFAREVADYCAWFCPEEKSYFDGRFDLFTPEETTNYLKVRQMFLGDNVKFDWPRLFRARNIDHFLLSTPNEHQRKLVLGFLAGYATADWRPIYLGGRTTIFTWLDLERGVPRPKGPPAVNLDELAFGTKSPQKAPEKGVEPFPAKPGFWDRFVGKTPPWAVDAEESQTYALYFSNQIPKWNSWRPGYIRAWQLATWTGAVGLASNGCGFLLGVTAANSLARCDQCLFGAGDHLGRPLVRGFSIGPPALPLLAVRAARRGVAARPDSAAAYTSLGKATGILDQMQERYWLDNPEPLQLFVRHRQGPLHDLRQLIRIVQTTAALEQAVELRPNYADAHLELALIYEQMHFLDAALQHFTEYVRIHQAGEAALATKSKAVKDFVAQLEQRLKLLNNDVRRRRNDFDLRAKDRPPLEKVKYAFFEATQEYRNGRGLGLLALKLLKEMDLNKLKEEMRQDAAIWQLHFLLLTGQVNEVRERMSPTLKKPLGLNYDYFQIALAAAYGNYREADQLLAELDKKIQVEKNLWQPAVSWLGIQLIDSASNPSLNHRLKELQAKNGLDVHLIDATTNIHPLMLLLRLQTTSLHQAQMQQVIGTMMHQTSQLRTMRGLLALESGDTVAARQHFESALRVAGKMYYTYRPLAERYLELLGKQK
jgi:hypothetical protein